MSHYQDRVNAERLTRQAPEVKKTAKAILEELKSIEQYLYWALDPEDTYNSVGYNCGALIDHTHTLIDLAHDYRAALKANPPPKEDEEDAACTPFANASRLRMPNATKPL